MLNLFQEQEENYNEMDQEKPKNYSLLKKEEQ